MSRTIRLLSDWGFHPFYVDEGDGRFVLTEPDDLRAAFGLPEHVMRTLDGWDRTYQDVLDRDDPGGSGWASPQDEQRYLERGRAAARLLRRHVPADVRIAYAGSGLIPTEYY